jgi:hypothetical protein
MHERTEGRIVRFFTKHAADEPFVEQWFLVAIGDDDKAKGAVSKVTKAGKMLSKSWAVFLPANLPVGA